MTPPAPTYRDAIATVDAAGHRRWLYPTQPAGRLYRRRKAASYVLLAVLVGLPFVEVGGEPLFRFDVLAREFRLFGVAFGPQDFYLAGLTMVTAIVAIALFTVVFGRLFCGWICPQTIFMELVFRRIEYAIEGSPARQRRLDASAWTAEKWRKRLLKHAAFFALAVGIAHVFLSYVIGWREVYRIATEPVGEHWVGLAALLGFSGVFYGVFARLREQVCTSICPYGRLQSVLVDDDTVGVAYDEARGEPRGKKRRGAPPPSGMVELAVVNAAADAAADAAAPPSGPGDCVDCGLCVRVCPTGIDIRDGFNQLERVHCTACVDACDGIMDKVGRPRGLIRYESRNGLAGRRRPLFTKRAYAYLAVLVALVSLNATLIVNRAEVRFAVSRAAGALPVVAPDGSVANLYTFRIDNHGADTLRVALAATRASAGPVAVEWVGRPPAVAPGARAGGSFFLRVPPAGAPRGERVADVEIELRGGPAGPALGRASTTLTYGNPTPRR